MAGTALQSSHEPSHTRDKQAPVTPKNSGKERGGGELDDDCSRPRWLTETPRTARPTPHELRKRLKTDL
ncbi:hypothetical protein P5673_029292 [Acropora cervicornis]|uniref:Uncharacterized protein n=1 Tax=Acropora cervicornis TaxID=6130 RepID=A0AAD9UUH3_ACRCE|nr:hypothetical protein P5673_029292 [Acropora cervicornis]